MKKQYRLTITALTLACFLVACGNKQSTSSSTKATTEATTETTVEATGTAQTSADELFTTRDLAQEADLTQAQTINLTDGKDVTIDGEGVYVLTGDASNTTVYVDVDKTEKVQLVLDGVTITNESAPCIYVKSADKVFITTTDTDNSLTVTGTFATDGDSKPDAVIFSKDDLVVNGKGNLKIVSSKHGITSKDDLKITGSTVTIEAAKKGLEANDRIAIGGGSVTITANEGMEATQITINDGSVNIAAADDGINATSKSEDYSPVFTLNGGTVTITMGQGDTDGVDSNGDIYINGGTISINGQSTFDYDGNAEYNGGTIIENGSETNTITNQMMGGPGGGFGGGPGGKKMN